MSMFRFEIFPAFSTQQVYSYVKGRDNKYSKWHLVYNPRVIIEFHNLVTQTLTRKIRSALSVLAGSGNIL